MTVVSVAITAATATVAAATTTTTLCVDMLVKLGKISICGGVTMWQMLRKRG